MASHGHGHDEVIVSQTTPQGTQENGVEYGHDMRDINVGSIMRWLVGTGVGVGLVLAFLVGLYRYMDNTHDYMDELPSPLFAKNAKPPVPRIEGFMMADDYGPLHAFPIGKAIPRDGTPEEMAVVRQEELAKLKSYGLNVVEDGRTDLKHGHREDPLYSDVLRRPIKVTPQQLAAVAAEGPAAAPDSDAKFVSGSPSDASGGLADLPHR